MPAHTPTQESVRVTVVESEACHFCVDAKQVLAEFAGRYPLEVRTVDARAVDGQVLMTRHRAPMSPLVLLDGDYFSSGRLPRRKLEKVLQARVGLLTAVGGRGVEESSEEVSGG